MINWRLLIPHQQYQIVIILWIYQWICGVRGSCGRNRYYHKTGGKNLQPLSGLFLESYLQSYLWRTISKSVFSINQDPQFKWFKVEKDVLQSHLDICPRQAWCYPLYEGGWWLVTSDRRPDLRHSGHAFPFPFLPTTTTAMPSHTLDGSLELEYW